MRLTCEAGPSGDLRQRMVGLSKLARGNANSPLTPELPDRRRVIPTEHSREMDRMDAGLGSQLSQGGGGRAIGVDLIRDSSQPSRRASVRHSLLTTDEMCGDFETDTFKGEDRSRIGISPLH